MEPDNSIRRRWRDTIIYAVVGVGLLAWAVALLSSTLVGAGLAGVCGACSLVMAYFGPASAPCPACGKILHDLSARFKGSLHRCPHCKNYSRAKERLEPVPEDFVADRPSFAVPVGLGERLPALCCVCAAPAERADELVEHRTTRDSPVTVVKTVLRVPVPYCATHKDGAAVAVEDQAPSEPLSLDSSRSEMRSVLRVRSYRFYRVAVGVK
jgi:predicted RNA-binding Zn-ribbon protein involved in translation (DUF1610 family)